MQQQAWIRFVVVALAITVAAACGSDRRLDKITVGDSSEASRAARESEPAAPAGLRAAYITAVQASASEAYRVEQGVSGLRAVNPAQGLVAEFTAARVRIAPKQEYLSWRLPLAGFPRSGWRSGSLELALGQAKLLRERQELAEEQSAFAREKANAGASATGPAALGEALITPVLEMKGGRLICQAASRTRGAAPSGPRCAQREDKYRPPRHSQFLRVARFDLNIGRALDAQAVAFR